MSVFKGSRYEYMDAYKIYEDGYRRTYISSPRLLRPEDINDQYSMINFSGDDLDNLAFSFAGNEKKWNIIADLNAEKFDHPWNIELNTELIIPNNEIFSSF